MEWEGIESYCGSKFWDANLTWHTDYPEFTKCFEQTVLVWLPIIFLWLFLPLDVYLKLHTSPIRIAWNRFNLTKIVINAFLMFLVMFDMGYQVGTPGIIYPIAYWTPLFQLSAYGLTLFLTIMHVKKGHSASGLLFLFWAFSVVCNGHAFRTDIRAFQNQIYNAVNVTDLISYLLKIALLILNIFADKPISFKTDGTEKDHPLLASSALSRFTISWYDQIAFLGYRRPLIIEDMWHLEKNMTSESVGKTFDNKWSEACKENKSRGIKGKKERVSAVLLAFKSYLPDSIEACVLRLIAEILAFASPVILKLMLAFLKAPDSNWKGFFYAVLLVVTSVLQSCISANSQLALYHFGLKVKSSLVGAIFKKSLLLSNTAKSESSYGEVVNMMSIDADKMMELAYYLMFMWTAPFQIIVTFILLWQLMGPAVIVGFSIMFVLLPVNWFFSKKIHEVQSLQMKSKDGRIKLVSEVLSGIKAVKLNAWEPCFENKVFNFRDQETSYLKRMAYLSSTMSCFWSCATCFMLLSTFGVFVLSDENNVLTVEIAFTAISLFNILHMTMFLVPYFINFISQAKVSVDRIDKYMNSEELNTNAVTHQEESDPLVMEKGSFSWDDNDDKKILKDISVRIKSGSLVAVVGSVGAGKSSLLSAFLGEMNKITGRVNTRGSIAYVPQVAWIQNDTVKGNVLFGKPLSSSRYSKVVEACALMEDFDMLPAGDMTEIGEKGINLSGGQKQRVSLARAVYFDSDIYLLDDPLSAVDSLVGKHIFEHVIGPKGLLRKKTRILVTHLVSYLPETDYVIVLKDGEVSEMGTYNELMNKNGSFKDFILNYSKEQEQEDEDEEEVDQVEDYGESAPLVKKSRSRVNSQNSSTGRKSCSSAASDDKLSTEDIEKQKGGLIEKEHTETGHISLQVVKNYINAMGIKWWCMIVTFCFIRQGFCIGGNYWISIWSTDKTVFANNSEDTSKRDMYLGVYGLITFCQAIASFLSDLIPLIACLKAAKYLHSWLLKSILRAPLSFFDTTPMGRIIARFAKDVDSLDSALPTVLTQSLNLTAELLGIVVVITISSPVFLVVIIPVGVIFFYIRRFYVASTTQIRRLVSVSRSPIYSHFSETLSGAFVIRAFRQQERFSQDSQVKVDTNIKAFYVATVANRWLSVRLESLGNIVIFFAAISAVLTKGDSNSGLLAMSLTYSLMITRVLLMLIKWSCESELNIVAAERIKEYCDITQERPWELPTTISKDWPGRGEVIFKDFCFRYREGLDMVLKNVSFTVHPGEKVGIVGRSGAGKSSLTLSLFRIIESAGGQLLIDGVDVSTLGLHRLRKSLNIISQDPVLFSGSLRMNLDPLEKYSDDELLKSVECARLKAFVSSLTAGLQYEISEGGSNLSAGQRQQVCLARALLNRTKILIMDEATAAIDFETDDLIQQTIRKEFADCTVLTIAHRINTIMDSDRVLVMDAGSVAEFDTPANLLANPKSIFTALARQAGATD